MSIFQLPPEIFQEIFAYSTVPELFTLRLVCRAFEQAIYPLIDLEIKVEESLDPLKCQLHFSIMSRDWDSTELARKLPEISYSSGNLDSWLQFTTKVIIDMSSLNMGVVEEFLRYFHDKQFDLKLRHICLCGFWPVYQIASHLSVLEYIRKTYPDTTTFIQVCLSKEFERSIVERHVKLKIWHSVQSLSVILYGSCASRHERDQNFGFLFDFIEVPRLNDLQNFSLWHFRATANEYQAEISSQTLHKFLGDCINLKCLALHNIFVRGPSGWNPTKAKVFPYENVAMHSSKVGTEMDAVRYSSYSGDSVFSKDYLLYEL